MEEQVASYKATCYIYNSMVLQAELKYKEVYFIKSVLVQNDYPLYTTSLNYHPNLSIQESNIWASEKKIFITLPYCGVKTTKLACQLKRMIGKVSPWSGMD